HALISDNRELALKLEEKEFELRLLKDNYDHLLLVRGSSSSPLQPFTLASDPSSDPSLPTMDVPSARGISSSSPRISFSSSGNVIPLLSTLDIPHPHPHPHHPQQVQQRRSHSFSHSRNSIAQRETISQSEEKMMVPMAARSLDISGLKPDLSIPLLPTLSFSSSSPQGHSHTQYSQDPTVHKKEESNYSKLQSEVKLLRYRLNSVLRDLEFYQQHQGHLSLSPNPMRRSLSISSAERYESGSKLPAETPDVFSLVNYCEKAIRRLRTESIPMSEQKSLTNSLHMKLLLVEQMERKVGQGLGAASLRVIKRKLRTHLGFE
ncbi:hypothetical protein ADUPG1_008202, partial [Aduncisulcus paluster]